MSKDPRDPTISKSVLADGDKDQPITFVPRFVRIIFQTAVTAMVGLLIAAFVGFLILELFTGKPILERELSKYTPVTIGLPLGAILSLVIVIVLEVTSGPVEMKIPGLTFKGSSGPIVLWVLCFLAISIAISINWPD